MKSKLKVIFVLVFSVNVSWALQVDEKLTLRVKRTSTTKKTILVNRGLEDGLSEGDHAKFFNSSGVVGRAVLVKVSPARSIWSVYKLVNPNEISVDKVLNLKISVPVKLTKDRSKMLSAENTPDASKVPLELGAEEDPGSELSESESDDLKKLGDEGKSLSMEEASGVAKNKSLEVWGLLQFDGLTSSSDLGTNGSATGSVLSYDVSFGMEKYFQDLKSWFHKVSFFLIFHSNSRNVTGLEGAVVELGVLEYGLGMNYHFLADAFAFNRLIGYFSVAFGFGQSEEASTLTSIGTSGTTQPYSGSSNFFSAGFGLKYYLSKGFGFRTILDYYRRGELYTIENSTSDFSKIVAGPRLQIGLSFRW